MLGCFRALQRVGINVTPNHFYWPIPDIAELQRRQWPARMPMLVFDFHFDRKLELLRTMAVFIDSSHVVATGGDVVREYLDILPTLQSGVVVHVHDIFLPSDYPREAVLKDMCFWSEQYLLQAFLSFNSSFEVLWASSAMQTFHREALDAAFPRWKTSYRKLPRAQRRSVPTMGRQRIWPSSFWIRRA